MSAPVVVTVFVKPTEAKLTALMFALQPMSLLAWMKEVVEPYIQRRAEQRFAGEGDDVSGKWKPLTQATINFRTQGQIDYGAGPINHRTGELENYITSSTGDYFTAGGDAVMVYPGNPASGELHDKMIAAQQGLSAPYTPARPVLGLNEQDLAAVLTQLEIFVMGV